MTSIQLSKLTMYRAVAACFNDYSKQLGNIPALLSAVNEFQSVLSAIDDTARQLAGTTSGISAAKTVAKENMARKAATAAGILRALADAEGDTILSRDSNIVYGTLFNMRDEQADDECEFIATLADKHLDKLESDYGFTKDMQEDLMNSIAAFRELTGKPKKAIADKSGTKTLLNPLFERADTLLKKRIDNLVALLETKDPEFVARYQANRTITDPRTTHTQVKGTVTDKNGKPLTQVKVTLSNNETSSSILTSDQGTYSLLIKNGIYQLHASLEGYPDYQRSDISVKLGQVTQLNIIL